MSELKQWFDVNKLSLNLNKTKIMLFGNCKTNIHVQVMIGNVEGICCASATPQAEVGAHRKGQIVTNSSMGHFSQTAPKEDPGAHDSL